MQHSGCMILLVAGLLLATTPNALAGRRLLQDATTSTPQLSPSGGPCVNLASPVERITSGDVFRAELNASNNIAPNATGVSAPPLSAPLNQARGTFELAIDNTAQRASWKLNLCDVPQYIASQLHIGSPAADYPPPLIPLEPYGKPSDPFAPPTLLPQLCPALNITGCTYTKEGSFLAADISPLPGRPGDLAVPAVANWAEFVAALRAGNIYINIHSLAAPANLIRGNLVPTTAAGTTTGTQVTAPAAETPLAETPVAEPPVTPVVPLVLAPVAEVPVAEAPAAETTTAPKAETPVAETAAPASEAPKTETLVVLTPAAEAPATETRRATAAAPAAETDAVIDGIIGDTGNTTSGA